ncbi:MAG: DUF6364 family protein [Cyclobacteriaceae bacterium]
MTTKLTLTIDDRVIDQAKKYAKKQNQSLSKLIENYLKLITQKEDEDEELPPITKALAGSIKIPKDFDYKKELRKRLDEKYG